MDNVMKTTMNIFSLLALKIENKDVASHIFLSISNEQ